ncbi:MAG TPA: adenosylmethionine decarboxylase [Thermotogota bacterium]|jgi:S-adenosylmethionine decarboxylase|nr:S-adenosylmethionine decarboxylase proenzyme [Thermotogota bacterium]NLH18895.1 S-adenosylmethionine decarboxylase proenzyme [Thermotogaceae bacterium]OQC32918.1 MAG: S-adenosylmethionine decarboxylase proenzyme precursor [Thermotogota bacterium ADurb.Bin062]HNW46052.1 adenosylmethionine decarboxylase [Thermotogota bacterium]HNY82087.1 adenosylmethionine decarboxylase [Thermotogota bacterium]
MKALGKHLIAEFYDCDAETLNDVHKVEERMKSAALVAGACIVDSSFHQFSPYGISGVVVISESHLSIHTWPEYGYAAVDVFTCGDHVDPWVAFDFLKKAFGAQRFLIDEYQRGNYKALGISEGASYKAVEATA